jgi:hypothetical protein
MSTIEMSTPQNVDTAKCQHGKMWTRQNVDTAKCWHGKMLTRQNVDTAKCQHGKMSTRQNVDKYWTKCETWRGLYFDHEFVLLTEVRVRRLHRSMSSLVLASILSKITKNHNRKFQMKLICRVRAFGLFSKSRSLAPTQRYFFSTAQQPVPSLVPVYMYAFKFVMCIQGDQIKPR